MQQVLIPRLQPREECGVTSGRSTLSSASRDNSTCKLQCTLFLKFGSHYCGEPPAPAGGDSTDELSRILACSCLSIRYNTYKIIWFIIIKNSLLYRG